MCCEELDEGCVELEECGHVKGADSPTEGVHGAISVGDFVDCDFTESAEKKFGSAAVWFWDVHLGDA